MLTITEAAAVNTVLAALLDSPSKGSGLDRCREDAELLADHAYKALSAGRSAAIVRAEFTDLAGRRAALIGFLDTFTDPDMLDSIGPMLTCTEADALTTLLSMFGQSTAATALYLGHAESDDEGDAHWNPNPRRMVHSSGGDEHDENPMCEGEGCYPVEPEPFEVVGSVTVVSDRIYHDMGPDHEARRLAGECDVCRNLPTEGGEEG